MKVPLQKAVDAMTLKIWGTVDPTVLRRDRNWRITVCDSKSIRLSYFVTDEGNPGVNQVTFEAFADEIRTQLALLQQERNEGRSHVMSEAINWRVLWIRPSQVEVRMEYKFLQGEDIIPFESTGKSIRSQVKFQ